MKLLAITVCLLSAVLVAVLIGNSMRRTSAKPAAPGVIPHNSVFHKPVNAECPQGTTLVPGYFSERDGTKQDACMNPNGDGSIDYLNPGEGFVLPLHIVVDPPDKEFT